MVPSVPDLKLDDVIEESREFLKDDALTLTDKEECATLIGWLDEYRTITGTDAAALDFGCRALRRMADRAERDSNAELPAIRHHANRLRKLINNMEELIELERKQQG